MILLHSKVSALAVKYSIWTLKDEIVHKIAEKEKKKLFWLLNPAKHGSWIPSKYCRKKKPSGQNSIVFSGLVKKCTTERYSQAHCISILEPHISNRSCFFQRKGESLCRFPTRKEIIMQTRQAFRAEEKCAAIQKATVSLIFFHIRAFTVYMKTEKTVSNCVSLELSTVCLAEADSKLLFPPWLSSEDQATYLFCHRWITCSERPLHAEHSFYWSQLSGLVLQV